MSDVEPPTSWQPEGPAYVQLGWSFRGRGGVFADDYTGRVVVSQSAFYLVIFMTPAQMGMAAGGGGLIGGLFAAMAGAGETIKRQVNKLTELPTEITKHPDWPVPPKKELPVIVIPREDIKRLRYSWWKTFDIITHEQTYYVGTRAFGRSKVLKRMREWGWEF